MLICLYRRNLLNMDKILFLIFIFATAFSLNNCMDDEFTHEILTFTARQLIKLYDVAKYEDDETYLRVHQDFLNACLNENYHMNPNSERKLSMLGLFDEENQEIPYRDIISKNLDQITDIERKIREGSPSRSENKSCALSCILY
jgi:hypothetical protein